MRPFTFIRPGNIGQALSAKKDAAQFIAGGTNLLDLMKKHISEPETLIDVNVLLPTTITSDAKGLTIGAMVKNSAVTTDAQVLKNFPLLAKAILAGASPQIRNMATTSGNMLQRTRCPYFYDITLPCNKRKPGSGCGALQGDNRMSAIVGWNDQCVAVHPSDLCISLATLDASVTIADQGGKNISVPFKDFHKLPENTPDKDNNLPANSIITDVKVPANAYNKHYSYVKLRDRDSYAFALVSVAAALQLDGNNIISARLASGGVAHKPWRWYEAEVFLKGKKATTSNFRQAAAIATGTARPLQYNKFKVTMLQGAIEVALQNCLTA